MNIRVPISPHRKQHLESKKPFINYPFVVTHKLTLEKILFAI